MSSSAGAAAPGRPFDLVFLADPPYATDPAQIFGLLGRAGDAGALARDLIVSYEHDASDDDAVEALTKTSRYEIASRRRHFGDTTYHSASFGFVHGIEGVFHSFSIMVEW